MEDTRRATQSSEEPSGDYEAPQVIEIWPVYGETLGSSTGGADSNGQGLY